MDKSKIKIALLVGGNSPEREVSKMSSKAIYKALKELNYNTKLIDPGLGLNQYDTAEKYFVEDEVDFDLSNENYVKTVDSNLFDDVDIAFIGLHGKNGEDGKIQSLLDLKGINYTGSKVLASAIAMEKSTSKVLFQHFDVTTPKWFVVEKSDSNYELMKDKIKKFFGYPCIIKANDGGSTIGLSVCRGDSEVKDAVLDAAKYCDKILIEEYIDGKEVTVGIFDHKALPVLEIIPKHKLYDYECKYTDGMTDYVVPADISEDLSLHLQHQALLAFSALGCENYGRVDFKVDAEGNSYCLEANTLPGMTSHSLLPKMAKADGISFNELIDKIIQYELKRGKSD